MDPFRYIAQKLRDTILGRVSIENQISICCVPFYSHGHGRRQTAPFVGVNHSAQKGQRREEAWRRILYCFLEKVLCNGGMPRVCACDIRCTQEYVIRRPVLEVTLFSTVCLTPGVQHTIGIVGFSSF